MNIIDEHCKINGCVHDQYSCTLNQTDIESNSNKFYVMQIIKTAKSYELFKRYGRIGETGTIRIESFSNEFEAINEFLSLYKSKTGNTFGTDSFTKKSGKYFLTTFAKIKDENIIKTDTPPTTNETNLDDTIDEKLKYLLDLISNEKMLSDTLIKLNIDHKKMPLGKISDEQINNAHDILNNLKQLCIDVRTNNIPIDDVMTEILNLSSQYYTYVPYSCGRKKPPVLKTESDIDTCIDLINELKNVQFTYSITQSQSNKNINRLSNVYSQLNAKVEPLDPSLQIFTELQKYVKNTHCATHYCKLEIQNIYTITKSTDANYDNFVNKNNITNKMLLFHGSPVANWCSIIRHGLCLDPSKLGVQITGKMFGYGIYFANAISKSFNYCGSEKSDNIAVLAIAEVAIGDPHIQYHSNSCLSQRDLDKVNKNSTWGVGANTPSSLTVLDNVVIPNGIIAKNNSTTKCDLLYDEFIIYNTDQHKIKYLIVVKNVIAK